MLEDLHPFTVANTQHPENCPFCDQEQMDKQLIFQDDDIMIIYCLTPATEGNVLVIPKRHVMRFEELSPFEILAVGNAIQHLARVFEAAYGVTDYLSLQKNGSGVGQTVAHIHWHVIPATVASPNDLLAAFAKRERLSDEELSEKAGRLRAIYNEVNAPARPAVNQ